jgi:hypothetical protein
MPSTYSSIGARVESDQDRRTLIDSVVKAGENIQFEGGFYVRWASGDGAELWVTMIGGKFHCITPFFRGESKMTFGITEDVERPPETVDGAVYGWMDPVDGHPESGAYPVAFDVVGKQLLGKLTLPMISEIKLCACARELTVYASESEFEAADPIRSPEYFGPVGVFRDGQRDARALVNGRVVETREYRNTLTARRYRWVLAKTFGGLVDVVFDPEQFDATPQVGGVVSGSFHLFGHIEKAR